MQSAHTHTQMHAHSQSRPLDPLPIQLLGPDPFKWETADWGVVRAVAGPPGAVQEGGKSPDAPKAAGVWGPRQEGQEESEPGQFIHV